MKIGYIRVSRDKQTTALQEDVMNKELCERVFTDNRQTHVSYYRGDGRV
jgi:DNA invertase Pin-like site-specific DNA recombinase